MTMSRRSKRSTRRALAIVAHRHAVLGQRRVQVDGVRHDRRADDADGDVQRLRAAEMRHEARQRSVHRRADPQGLVQKAEEDDPEQRRDRQLEAAKAMRLQLEDRDGDDAGHQAGPQQRHAEQQVQAECRADELGDVCRHRHDLRLQPHDPARRPRVVLAKQLREGAIGGDADLRRQVLDQHRHQIRGEHDPQQQIAEPGAAGDVRGEVARVDVGDRRDERRAEHRQRRAQPALGEQQFEMARAARRARARRDRSGGRSFEYRVGAHGRHVETPSRPAPPEIASARSTPRGRRSKPARSARGALQAVASGSSS